MEQRKARNGVVGRVNLGADLERRLLSPEQG
jgi:hypothetical protein